MACGANIAMLKTSYCDRPLLRLLAPFHQQQRRKRVYTIDDYYNYWLIITNKRINLERVKKNDYIERNVRNLKNHTSLLLCNLWKIWDKREKSLSYKWLAYLFVYMSIFSAGVILPCYDSTQNVKDTNQKRNHFHFSFPKIFFWGGFCLALLLGSNCV